MEVHLVSEPTKHAIFGGKEARRMQTASSAHGFKVMSDTLYQNKIKAVAREYLCNAYDAHVAAGKLDTPIEVTLDTHLTIRDFGHGIHDDNIVDVYCTLFGSTKRKDDRQTGGFGLGSKVGFAYADHFQVTSIHEGVKTIYQMHIGGVEDDGMPLCQPIVSVPSTEPSGIEIKIEVGKKEDDAEFIKEIRYAARAGGMLVKFNNSVIKVPDYTEIDKKGFGFVKAHDIYGEDYWRRQREKIAVRLGTVLYPIDANPRLNRLISSLQCCIPEDYCMILSMKPGTVQMTPAREALSYNVDTLDSLEKALRPIVALLEPRIDKMVSDAKLQFIKSLKLTRMQVGTHDKDIRDRGTLQNYLPKLEKKDTGLEHCAILGARSKISSRGHDWHYFEKEVRRLVPEKRHKKWKRRRFVYRKLTRLFGNEPINFMDNYGRRANRINFLTRSASRDFYNDDRGPFLRYIECTSEIRIVAHHGLLMAERSRGCHLLLNTREMSEEAIEAFKERAKKFSFKFERVVPPTPKEVEKIAEEKVFFRVLSPKMKSAGFRDGNIWYALTSAPQNAAPDSYMEALVRQRDFRKAIGIRGDEDAMKDFFRLFPATAIAHDSKTLKRLQARGLPSVQRVLLDRLREQIEGERGPHQAILMAQLSARRMASALPMSILYELVGVEAPDLEALEYDKRVWRVAKEAFENYGILRVEGGVEEEDAKEFKALVKRVSDVCHPKLAPAAKRITDGKAVCDHWFFRLKNLFDNLRHYGHSIDPSDHDLMLKTIRALNAYEEAGLKKAKRKEKRA